jgi:hypothetical protein
MSFANYVARVFGKTAIWVYRIEVPGETFHLTGWPFNGAVKGWVSGADRPDLSYPAGVQFDFAGINRGEITETTASTRSEVWVSLPTLHPAMVAAQAWDEPEEITVTVWVTYLDDPDEEYVLRFSGRVTGIEPGKVLSRLICEDALTEMDRASAAQVASIDCRHNHYFTEADGTGCTLDLADWQQTAPVTAVTAKVLTVPLAALQPDGTYRLGILEHAGTEYLIASHVGETLTLDRVVPGLAAAVALDPVDVLIAPGCDKKIATCVDRFDNVLFFGGNPGMVRGETPFDGRSIA